MACMFPTSKYGCMQCCRWSVGQGNVDLERILHQIPIIGRLIWLKICAQQLAFVFCSNFLPVPSMISSRHRHYWCNWELGPLRREAISCNSDATSPTPIIWFGCLTNDLFIIFPRALSLVLNSNLICSKSLFSSRLGKTFLKLSNPLSSDCSCHFGYWYITSRSRPRVAVSYLPLCYYYTGS